MPRLRMSGGIALCAFMAWQDSFTFCLWGDWMDHYEYLCLLPDLVPLDTTIMVHYVLECNCLIVAESRQQTKICAVSAMLFCALWYAPRMMCHIKLPYQTLWQQNSVVQTPSIWMPASRQKREPAYLANANPCIPPPPIILLKTIFFISLLYMTCVQWGDCLRPGRSGVRILWVTAWYAGPSGPAYQAVTYKEWYIPDDVLIQLILLMMSTGLLETCREMK